jgi:hypothetical protein
MTLTPQTVPGETMRDLPARSWLISAAAIGLALVWGAVEFLALQRSWFMASFRQRKSTAR